MKLMYNLWYRFGTPPWVGGARRELVRLVEQGSLLPGRALDLGCGEGDNAIFLALHGFEVTAVDFAPAAIRKAEAKASVAGADVTFLVDDLSRLQHVDGQFDVLVDYGTFDDLTAAQRAAYCTQVVPLARPGAKFLMWNFEWETSLWERLAARLIPFGNLTLAPGYVEATFSGAFDVQRIAGETGLTGWPKGWAAYLMTKRA
ncbi:bifunctional 2-polyprenyl-6-hydroxyphenol methylase/3-demethylubiquinol 3-O-methyltransferase UbiG [Arthrobacter sp. CJ23]|uniref:class I SAM-dependent methyltransferase n=1 Tax=Arthrobacter sp. CJ23 TaxID=2972479 RepID=UPI00215CCB95|nr:class I SAM-dependent methyltransferase [Arthrobacter sp. CJ23]UVJ40764.1 class I SAM-dependent methyltransferase [Arthrobacter sp. CJ23]